MIYLNAVLNQQFAPDTLPDAVRAALGKPLRRASSLSQLAVAGALACVPADRRHLPTALLWQSSSGSRLETTALLEEVCNGPAEPLPYDFLATQPAIAAAQLQPYLPGLVNASHWPLADEKAAHWSLLLSLARNWLAEGRYAQVLCAHLDRWADIAHGHWLLLGTMPSGDAIVLDAPSDTPADAQAADTPDFPRQLADWLHNGTRRLLLHSPAAARLAVEFARH